MLVIYRCQCGVVFDGHWNHAEYRLKHYPHIVGRSKIKIAMVCPQCGNDDIKRNIESDEEKKVEEDVCF